jgi:hypothetical protein
MRGPDCWAYSVTLGKNGPFLAIGYGVDPIDAMKMAIKAIKKHEKESLKAQNAT